MFYSKWHVDVMPFNLSEANVVNDIPLARESSKLDYTQSQLPQQIDPTRNFKLNSGKLL